MSWLMLSLAFLLSVGYAKLSTAALNRLQAIPQPKWLLVVCEVFQLLSMPAYACYSAIKLVQQASSLQDLSWDRLNAFDAMLIGLGAVGFLLLVRSTLKYQWYRPPSCEIGNESSLIDFRQSPGDLSWQQRYVGPRPMRRIALLPGNQQFTLEVSTKTYLLPRLPKEWDGLSIVHFADTHFRGAVTRAYFQAVCERAVSLNPDIFVFTGDLLDDPALLEWLPETLGSLRAPLGQYFILGNHDWYLDANAERKQFERHGWIDLSSRTIELASPRSGPPLVLAGDETPWMGVHPDLSRVSTDAFRILLSHTPDNINWARKQGVDLMLAGHTHGGQIRLPLLGPIYSPSLYGCRFAAGVFKFDPTLLYVSRGISGREPIRYNCTPELTKLVLRSNVSNSSTTPKTRLR